MKDAEYHVVDDLRDRSKCPRNYLMAFICGIGVGVGVMMYWHEKPRIPEKRIEYETIATSYGEIILTEKQEILLRKGLKDIERKNGWFEMRVLHNWRDILGRHGPQVMDENIKKVIDDTLNPVTPMGRLLNKYRGPKATPQPSQADEEQFDELCQKYELYQPTIDALMDENHDNETTREERNRAVYKLLHQ